MSSSSSPNTTPPHRPQPSSTTPSNSLGVPAHNSNLAPPTIAINPPSSPSPATLSNHNNADRNNRSLSSTSVPSSPWPSNRYNPPVPSRMSGTYSSNNSIYHGNLGNHGGRRLGTSSASSSPPGTPPNGLRDYYLNAALQRSQHRFYSTGSASNSSANLQRLNISVNVPSGAQPRRSYSADQLAVEEPEITVTTPGGSNSTEDHVMTLQRALSNLIKQEGREVIENYDDEAEGPIMMKSKKSTSVPGTVSAGNKDGIMLTPTVLANRQDPEKTALSHGIVGSAVTLEEQETPKEKTPKDKRRSHNRLSNFFNRDPTATAVPEQHKKMDPTDRPVIQPSKTGVLSNLLKLQGNVRAPKTNHSHTPPKHKDKKKRPTLYSRSANNSVTSFSTKSVFGTYPPLPNTTDAQGIATGLGNVSTVTQRNGNGNGNATHAHSFQLDGGFAGTFSQGPSPMQSPNGSPRESFSYDMSGSSTLHSLSAEEKMRITFAVADILQRQDYVLRLARAMIKFGAPSHRLEDAIDHTARTLELNLQCIYMPNVMVIAFTDYETHTSETHLLKVSAGLDMFRFAQVHQILKMVTHSSMPVEEAIMKLDAINAEKDLWPRWANILGYAVASSCTAPMFFKGNWVDAGFSFLIGGTVGLMSWLSEKVPSYAHICEVTMSVVVAFVAEALHNQVCRSSVKMAGIVMLLPGYTITCSVMELSSRHMISGSVRLFYAVIFSLLLGYGLTIGASLWNLIDPSSTPAAVTELCPESLDAKWNILFVPAFAITLNISLKAHPRQWPLAMVLSVLGYVISYATATWGGAKTEVSSALASFAIGFCGNIYQRMTHQLTFQAVICAVFFLVPGSMGLKGAMAWFTDDMAGGVNFALQMVVTAIAISVGLFASALVVYPMGKARSAQMTF
ncbi:hypothetical protein EDD21DRAFT_363453 [Dissophora ornata]|nr:hypothetical protein BGZ58_005525 [Dissophora ornata]KAI8605456.1 hypothetical protein EDD21DRAFT_363453 [Dissophora ornata]